MKRHPLTFLIALAVSVALSQSGATSALLPATQMNVDVIGKLRLTTKADQISSVAVLGDYAYVGNASGGLPTPACRGGVHVVDITDPSSPQKIGFLPSHPGTYVAEGLQALHVKTGAFSGDLLLVSNERCESKGIGGLTVYDITDPLAPIKLSDTGDSTNGHFTSPTSVDPVAHDSRTVLAWQSGSNVYAVAVDNQETALDLDFFC